MESGGVHTKLGSWSEHAGNNMYRVLNMDFHLEFQVPSKVVVGFFFFSIF